jgi:hypothetical protein
VRRKRVSRLKASGVAEEKKMCFFYLLLMPASKRLISCTFTYKQGNKYFKVANIIAVDISVRTYYLSKRELLTLNRENINVLIKMATAIPPQISSNSPLLEDFSYKTGTYSPWLAVENAP